MRIDRRSSAVTPIVRSLSRTSLASAAAPASCHCTDTSRPRIAQAQSDSSRSAQIGIRGHTFPAAGPVNPFKPWSPYGS